MAQKSVMLMFNPILHEGGSRSDVVVVTRDDETVCWAGAAEALGRSPAKKLKAPSKLLLITGADEEEVGEF